jgi:hypothetical protein
MRIETITRRQTTTGNGAPASSNNGMKRDHETDEHTERYESDGREQREATKAYISPVQLIMASVQVNFYLTPDEQPWLDELLGSSGPIRIVMGMSNAFRPQFSSTTVLHSPGDEDLKIHLVREQDIELLHTREVPNQREWFVDVLRSPVVECLRCFTDGKILRRGRLYFIEDYYDDNGRLVKKHAEYLKWARGLIRKVRRGMRKRDDGDYMSQGVVEADSSLRLTAS